MVAALLKKNALGVQWAAALKMLRWAPLSHQLTSVEYEASFCSYIACTPVNWS